MNVTIPSCTFGEEDTASGKRFHDLYIIQIQGKHDKDIKTKAALSPHARSWSKEATDASDSGWIVARRFSEFVDLHRVLESTMASEGMKNLPNPIEMSLDMSDETFLSPDIMESRRTSLELYLQV